MSWRNDNSKLIELARLMKLKAPLDPVRLPDGTLWDGKVNYISNANKTYYGENRYVGSMYPRTQFRQYASRKAPKVRWDIRGGNQLFVIGWEYGETISGENRWWITASGARIWCGHTDAKPKERKK